MVCKTPRGNVRKGCWGDGRRSNTWENDFEKDSVSGEDWNGNN